MVEDSNKKPRQSGLAEKEVILLGLIAEEPIHAYGIEEKIRIRSMTEWTDISFSSIYRVLARLEEDGLIDSRLEHGGQGATRKVLAINEAGLRALAAGVVEQLAVMHPIKNPFVVGLTFIARAPYAEVVPRLEQRLQQLCAAQETLRHASACAHAAVAASRPDPVEVEAGQLCARLLFDYVLRHLGAEEAFLRDTLQLLPGVAPRLFSNVDLTAAPAPAAATDTLPEVKP